MYVKSNIFIFTYFIEVNVLHSNILHHGSLFIYVRCDNSESSTALPKHPCHWRRNIDKLNFLQQDNIGPLCDSR